VGIIIFSALTGKSFNPALESNSQGFILFKNAAIAVLAGLEILEKANILALKLKMHRR